jgi:hypothetical protein
LSTSNSDLAPADELVRIEIAEIVISVLGHQPREDHYLPPSYQYFMSESEPEIVIHTRRDGPTLHSLEDRDRVFDSGSSWALYEQDGRYALLLGASSFSSEPYGIALFDSEIRQIDVFLQPEQLPNGLLPDPLQFPLGEVLMVCLLAQGRGLMVHACGVNDGGQGYLFAGQSTHGKSTMARQWQDEALVLNDDRIVLRQREGRFWMYSTPWHGDHTGISAQAVPLDKLFFLRHDRTNCARRRQGVAAASMLLARSFPPLSDADGMRFTLDFCAQLVDAVPCFDLGFVPSKDVLDTVRCAS